MNKTTTSINVAQQQEALAKSIARNTSSRVIDAQRKDALRTYERLGAGSFEERQLGIERDSFLSAVVKHVEELAAQEGLVVSTLFLEDFALSAAKALPLNWTGFSAEYEADEQDADFLLLVGAGNDDVAWGEMEDVCHLRHQILGYGVLGSFVRLPYLDSLNYIDTTLISEKDTDGRSLWLMDVRTSDSAPISMVAKISGEAVAAACPELNFYELTREGTPEFEQSAAFLAELVWKRPHIDGLTTFFDAYAYLKNEDSIRKLFMGLDECKFDQASIEPFAVSPEVVDPKQ